MMTHRHTSNLEQYDDLPDDPAGTVIQRIRSDRETIERLRETVVQEIIAAGYTPTAAFAIRLAFEEAVSNAIHHGNRMRPGAIIEIAYHVSPERIHIRVSDEGSGFNPYGIVDPTLDENLETLSGRGLLLMRAYMTRVIYNGTGNAVALVYDRPDKP